jgi:penicillin-binding protein 2B
MPDLRGFSAREAVRLLAELGLEVQLQGQGVVASQSIAAQAPIVPGDVCRIRLSPESLRERNIETEAGR